MDVSIEQVRTVAATGALFAFSTRADGGWCDRREEEKDIHVVNNRVMIRVGMRMILKVTHFFTGGQIHLRLGLVMGSDTE